MKRWLALTLVVFIVCGANAQKTNIQRDIQLDIAPSEDTRALFHWKISNNGEVSVYVYDFYLWGPAFRVEREAGKVRIETTLTKEKPSCPPNRFPPVLLLWLPPGRTISGEFYDPIVRIGSGEVVTFTVAVGTDPYNVQARAFRYMSSNCKHNPYDAIVQWGTIVDSNQLLFR